MKLDVTPNDLDQCIWEEELDDFVPQRIFDAHTHVHDFRNVLQNTDSPHPFLTETWRKWPLVTWEMLNEADRLLLPGREVHRIAFGNPLFAEPLEDANAFTAREASSDPESIALMLVRPDVRPEDIAGQVSELGFRGLKPYRTNSITGDFVECRITDYLPEPQIEAADKLGLIIMLHLSKHKAVADPDNLDDLERLTGTFPNVKWVLAHCARSYYDRPLLQAADRLGKIPNLWFDISSVCDADAMDALLAVGGPDRVMYASDDIPVGVTRGKYVTFGHAWADLCEHNQTLRLAHCDPRMTFTRYESLRAFRRATRRHGYGKAEIEKLFCLNAQQLIASTAP